MTRKLDPKIKAAWLEALRSGKYAQGTQYLHRDGHFCCLGVLCDLYVKEHPKTARWQQYDGMSHDLVLNDPRDADASSLPPLTVHAWARGISREEADREQDLSVRLPNYNHDVPLFRLNDSYGMSFEQIAKYIEEQL
jgi:hypothetical protein